MDGQDWGAGVAASGNYCFCGQMRTHPGIGVMAWMYWIGVTSVRERVFYIHELIVWGIARVGKGRVSAGEGLFVVTPSGAEGFADGIEILRWAQNDRAGLRMTGLGSE